MFVFWKVLVLIIGWFICFVIIIMGIEFIWVVVIFVIRFVVLGLDVVKYIFILLVVWVYLLAVWEVFCLCWIKICCKFFVVFVW